MANSYHHLEDGLVFQLNDQASFLSAYKLTDRTSFNKDFNP
jgi:hypothetical protein